MKVFTWPKRGRTMWLALCIAAPIVLALSFVAGAEEATNDTCFSCHNNEGFSTSLENSDEMNLFVAKDSYLDSVHGSMDFSCDTCHEGYVEYPHPEKSFISTRGFAVQTNQACVNCHPDQAATYKNEFHGKTLAIRQQRSLATGKPISKAPEAACSDCHGSHDLLRTDNPASRVNPANVAATCQSCHEKATPAFALAFSGHQPAAPTNPKSAITYWINAFYSVIIPALLGSLGLFMLLELAFMLRRRQHTHE